MISLASAYDRARWNGYVERHPQASVYHRWEWLEVFEQTYGTRSFPLMARYEGRVTGVLPMVRVGPPGLPGSLVSLPWFGHGGALAADDATWRCLLDAAAALRDELGAAHVELRHAHPVPAQALPTRSGKVLMHLDVSEGEDALLKALGAKTRADIRRPEKEGMTAHVGGAELLGDFHAVYAEVMRDLGSPSHPRRLFARALAAMPDRSFVVVVRYEGGAVGGGFLVGMGDTLEIPCAGTRHAFSRLRGNMLLYWTVIREAIRRGYRCFSFGRSTEGSGTYTFKKNWGARPVPLPYHYLLPPGRSLPARAGESQVLTRVSHTWQRLPTAFTTRVGPRLVRWLP